LGRSPEPAAEAGQAGTADSGRQAQVEPSYPQARPIDEKRPVRIKSDRLRYNDRAKETEFIGNVVASQDTATLYADRMRSSTQGESASAKGSLRLLDTGRKIEILAEEGDYSGALSEANLRGGVTLHSVDPYAVPVTVTGQTGWYHSLSRKARLGGGVKVERGTLTATAKSADVDGEQELIELLGEVRAMMGANRIEADRAELDGKRRSVVFEGGVQAWLLPAEIRQRASQPEKP
jgi:lipopolysaccharide transport protein LptA